MFFLKKVCADAQLKFWSWIFIHLSIHPSITLLSLPRRSTGESSSGGGGVQGEGSVDIPAQPWKNGGSQGQQFEQGHPHFPLPVHLLQLSLSNPRFNLGLVSAVPLPPTPSRLFPTATRCYRGMSAKTARQHPETCGTQGRSHPPQGALPPRSF